MNKRLLGIGLRSELTKGYDISRISRWAFKVFFEDPRTLDPTLQETLEMLFSMDGDPQFELTEKELSDLADKLIVEGDKEELSNDIPEIKEKAMDLGDHWVMCPFCQEAWEQHSIYPMIRCPKCNNILHMPS